MKRFLFFVFITACASNDSDWDTGANRMQMQQEAQRDEQVDNTNRQLTTPGRSGAGQHQPWR